MSLNIIQVTVKGQEASASLTGFFCLAVLAVAVVVSVLELSEVTNLR